MRLFLRLVNEFSGKVLWSGMSEKTGSEWIQEDDVPNVENHNIPFTRGKYASRSKSIGLFQPLLVSTAAGVIVYLFYALRSR